MRLIFVLLAVLATHLAVTAQNVTIHATDRPADEVFHSLMEQTGRNFVYPSDLLTDMRVTVSATRRPLAEVLKQMFQNTDIKYSLKGTDVILKRAKPSKADKPATTVKADAAPASIKTIMPPRPDNLLQELVVVSRLSAPVIKTPEIGARKVTADDIYRAPTLFGESDIMKTLQLEPGVVAGTDGSAAMHVHGGGSDENLFLLDNVPLYHVNHVAGLFSAFNTDMVRYVDFYKSSIPAKYDGRLSSVMDVRTRTGIPEKFNGSARLGLTSGALNLNGPIGNRTAYSLAMRRSWIDLITLPISRFALSNESEKNTVQYFFTDINAKLSHYFNDRTHAFVSMYYGKDKIGISLRESQSLTDRYDESFNFDWGNFLVQTGVNHRFNSRLSAEFTGAFTKFFSGNRMTLDYTIVGPELEQPLRNFSDYKSRNNVNDYIVRADFKHINSETSTLRFGASGTWHNFMPSHISRRYIFNSVNVAGTDTTNRLDAAEIGLYAENEWRPSDNIIANAGINASTFIVNGRAKYGISPRLSASWNFADNWALKGALTRTTQYVHMMQSSFLALPTDQWIPVSGDLKPQTANKISLALYRETADKQYTFGMEAYYKDMRNILEYKDDYYLTPPIDMWTAQVCAGRGTAKGIDFKVEKHTGRLTGHVAYSLGWANRTFAEKNQGRTYPARFDNRHTINILVNWNISRKLQLNAAWTGHTGNRFTMSMQEWDTSTSPSYGGSLVGVQAPLNNCRLPFYHNLDLAVNILTKNGYWSISIYNAYNHRNAIAVYKDIKTGKFKLTRFLPIIPSISYTWKF